VKFGLLLLSDRLTQELPKVVEHSHQLRQNAQVIDELDVAVSFARLAHEMNFVRPEIGDE
jgi:DNA mismatch repair ATPase MutS